MNGIKRFRLKTNMTPYEVAQRLGDGSYGVIFDCHTLQFLCYGSPVGIMATNQAFFIDQGRVYSDYFTHRAKAFAEEFYLRGGGLNNNQG